MAVWILPGKTMSLHAPKFVKLEGSEVGHSLSLLPRHGEVKQKTNFMCLIKLYPSLQTKGRQQTEANSSIINENQA